MDHAPISPTWEDLFHRIPIWVRAPLGLAFMVLISVVLKKLYDKTFGAADKKCLEWCAKRRRTKRMLKQQTIIVTPTSLHTREQTGSGIMFAAWEKNFSFKCLSVASEILKLK